jgi:thymidylate synthase (FAD)
MKYVKPQVFLLAETKLVDDGVNDFLKFLNVPEWKTDAASDTEKLIEIAGKTCYMSFSTDLNKNLTRVGTRNNEQYLQEGLIKTRHGSVIEHGNVTFALMNVSRVLTHELIRHRAGAAYSQLSGRYVRLDEILMTDLPSCIANDGYATDVMTQAIEQTENFVQTLSKYFDLDNSKDFAFKKEVTSAIRRIIGNGQANHIIATFNHRAIRHIISMRSSAHAEEEIRRVAEMLWEIVSVRYPSIYADGKVEVINGIKQITFEYDKI